MNCRYCGFLIGAMENHCSNCGAPLVRNSVDRSGNVSTSDIEDNLGEPAIPFSDTSSTYSNPVRNKRSSIIKIIYLFVISLPVVGYAASIYFAKSHSSNPPAGTNTSYRASFNNLKPSNSVSRYSLNYYLVLKVDNVQFNVSESNR